MAFSSLNLLLHTQALLSTINFLTAVVPSSGSGADAGPLPAQEGKQHADASSKKGMTDSFQGNGGLYYADDPRREVTA